MGNSLGSNSQISNRKISHLKISSSGDSYILYDADILDDPTVALFDSDYHINRQVQQNNSAQPGNSAETGMGRARVIYFELENKSLVLKHYLRGGLAASLTKDRYLWSGLEKTRAFKECRLLKKMQALDLPVPSAVAAHVKKGLLTYQADLITEEINDAVTLADILGRTVLDETGWRKIGACIKNFHHHDIYHADLNARNILITDAGGTYLIDFDNSYIRAASETWKMANLARLKRSLVKFKRNQETFNFDEASWSALVQGYNSTIAE
ncbi:MAG: 3-deoxy-D-manno-octulosonic acid kinase [Gammaproteobacteria bacterium]|nr:3-deoxy-D-manno-octulosonic acid kinase [Gammaproteobacteria bacterium]